MTFRYLKKKWKLYFSGKWVKQKEEDFGNDKNVIFLNLSNWIFTFFELVKWEFSRPSKSCLIRQKTRYIQIIINFYITKLFFFVFEWKMNEVRFIRLLNNGGTQSHNHINFIVPFISRFKILSLIFSVA